MSHIKFLSGLTGGHPREGLGCSQLVVGVDKSIARVEIAHHGIDHGNLNLTNFKNDSVKHAVAGSILDQSTKRDCDAHNTRMH